MPYLTDTQRVEMALPSHMLMAVLVGYANTADPGPQPRPHARMSQQDRILLPERIREWQQAWIIHKAKVKNDPDFAKGYEEFLVTQAILKQAMEVPVQDLYPAKKKISVLNRIANLHADIVQPYVDPKKVKDPDPRKIGLMAWFFTKLLIETGYIITSEDSPLWLGLVRMMPALSPDDAATDAEIEEYRAITASAKKQIKALLRSLQEREYYVGLSIPDDF